MASPEEYARWIVANQDKKGTPEFETVAKAYQVAKGQPKEQPAAPKKPTILENAMQRAKNAFALTPPGVAFNVVGGAMQAYDKAAYEVGGKVTDVTGSPKLGAAANVAMQALPTFIGGGAGVKSAQLAEKAGKPTVMEAGAKKLMHQALKPSALAQEGGLNSDAAKAIDTLLRADANVSTAGAVKLRGLINKLEGEAQTLIANAAKEGKMVDKGFVVREVLDEFKKFRNQVNPGADTKAILKSWEEFSALVGEKIPVSQAHSLKQGTYKILADKYAKMGRVENVADTQAQMAQARGLRKGTEAVVPGIGEITTQEASLINALELAEKRAGIGGNKDIGGIAWLAHNPVAATAFMADRSNAFKSWLANRIFQARMAPSRAVGAGAVIGAEQAAKQ